MKKTRYQFNAGDLVKFTESVGVKSIFKPETFVCQIIQSDRQKSTVQILSCFRRGETMIMENSALSKFSPPTSLM
ncbi:hypothetical protein COU00_00445 [Candidatus Falkowbacteria bacterium CG10_big_fil_rev_8_21_14_0_10_43_11]|uniref:Uncharacterized protein n=1 Tax=Candidatus Falkowbacteria bacterium CG10_big_fil_rev_8_21_14_0_10_43_11 TaxID=1974568 RepID=A0A2M6WMY0_9BACT|nr:MAG: hypothetical protein COU00_00445 [Candidatus Falkowbacteria bacterium CG10_big_fil_rev_8_21_14_0_10_43_11]